MCFEIRNLLYSKGVSKGMGFFGRIFGGRKSATRLARVPDHLAKIDSKIAVKYPWIKELSEEWKEIYSSFLVVQQKTRAKKRELVI
jgi:hypothetical protein